MGIGFGIFMFVAGAVMAFALNVDVPWIDLSIVGNILMIAGLIAVIGALILNRQNRQTTVRQVYDNRATPTYDARYGQQQTPTTNQSGYDQSGYDPTAYDQTQQPRHKNQSGYNDQGY